MGQREEKGEVRRKRGKTGRVEGRDKGRKIGGDGRRTKTQRETMKEGRKDTCVNIRKDF